MTKKLLLALSLMVAAVTSFAQTTLMTTNTAQNVTAAKSFSQDTLCINGASTGKICFRTSAAAGTTPLNIGTGGTLGALSFVTPGTDVATALGANIGSAGAPVLFNGAGGTPSSIDLTNATNVPASSLTATYIGYGSGSNRMTGDPSLTYALGTIISEQNANGVRGMWASNLSSGNAASSYYTAVNDVGSAVHMRKLSSGYTTSGLLTANAGVFSNFASTGTMLLVQQAALDMIFTTGGSGTANEKFRIKHAGGFDFKDTSGSTVATIDNSGSLTAGDVPVARLSGTGTVAGLTAGSATVLATARAIYGNNFDGSAALTQIIASTYGGTGNGFTKFSGPASTEKTFTLPNVSATILTDNAAVTVAQGGTGIASATAYGTVFGGTTSTGAFQTVAACASGAALMGGGTSALPSCTGSPSFSGTVSDALGDVRLLPQNKQNAAYTFAASDCGKHVYHDESTTARTYTINSNANLALSIGCTINIVNGNGTGVITLAITSDTLRLSGGSSTGSRSIAANCVVTIIKVDTTLWYVTGGACLTYNEVPMEFLRPSWMPANDAVYEKVA